ncbi:hypothetical protein NESM_000805900 [Novymonas esmeraldas]|uniref:Pre-mRNA-splicing factor SLU7 n=1 Tax=Novymonas esmeraldas TaxID=1808958 RepID=A0AAW0EY66_9TRYP
MEPNSDQSGKSSSVRQLLRQQRELQEMRKFGLAPLAVDTETHQEISPNIPEFISRAPWYYGATGPTLVHQRKQDGSVAKEGPDEVLSERKDRVVVTGQATRFTAGACRNCGSRTHKTSECFQAKKRVGSVYTNRVTGADISTEQTAKTYSQKRDRFVGEVGVDLMRGVRQDAEVGDGDGDGSDSGSAATRRRLDGVFGTRTAQHGGVEVKELPKYLHNLDQQDGLFFDPKTGSMRANPNAGDASKAFQGDLERYRSGDYYNYVESQHRFLTGQSRSFVDFEFDDAMRHAREQQLQQQNAPAREPGSASTPAETPQDVLLRSLYGTSAPTFSSDVAEAAPSPSAASSPAPVVRASSPPAVAAAAAPAAPSSSIIRVAALSWTPTRHGHAAVYGSYFDPAQFRWGYACCKATDKDVVGCDVGDV